MTDLKNLCQQVINVSRETGAFIKSESQKIGSKDIQSKGTHDYVTYVDKASEERLVSSLEKILPGSGFIAEENTREYEKSEYTWIVDPIDGTTNFIHGLPFYSISIGLMHNDELVLGVIYEPNLDEIFYSWKGAPAYLNGSEIHVSDKPTLKDSLVATGFPYHNYDRLETYMELFRWTLHNTHGVRRIGSAAVDLAYVACGRFEAFFEYGLSPWDVAAGGFLVQQAGGKVSDFFGNSNYIFAKDIMASNHHVYEEFLQQTTTFFKK